MQLYIAVNWIFYMSKVFVAQWFEYRDITIVTLPRLLLLITREMYTIKIKTVKT